ncbi:hypothetical protein PSP20601_03062 [Pandoraea sputorum]|uniref:Lipoprotein n=1 Tax=Pandoraea sputorum TaxID=93222 RepID=A0A239SVC0_9BURK|nr:Uncharacterised protein [Pandoraea sputorum]VVE19332.1 hypothetical protein PSP20601_03062 [Pandoraea sputorum]
MLCRGQFSLDENSGAMPLEYKTTDQISGQNVKLNATKELAGWVRLVGACVVAAGILSACAPAAVVNKDKLASVKTVAVVTAEKPVYRANSVDSARMIGFTPTDLIVAAVANVAGAVGNANREKNTASFDELVTQRVGDTGVNRKVTDGVIDVFRRQGYNVVEVSAEQFKAVREGAAPEQKVDAYVQSTLAENYFAASSLAAFMRTVKLSVQILGPDAKDVIYSSTHTKLPHDAPYYNTYARMVDDLPTAVQGLDSALLTQLPEFAASFKSAR